MSEGKEINHKLNLKALNASEKILKMIDRECKRNQMIRLQEAGHNLNDPDATYVPDVQYYKDFIERLLNSFNVELKKSVYLEAEVEELKKSVEMLKNQIR